ncbi:hypothetical protein 8014-B2_0092 [Lactobacillus phage ATCC 8014-B2]|uniref:Uncharacterized protein n=1 Tax=Lactobacillus phage ATCC 8014-B2 TaxID=1225795 RepID=K4ID99_9CAUD|nr:hypothetical protein HOQ89_gp054 [Lactobacillus phage ATCC 8014-B2]AFU63159.1 hypothetical protein 8014-B2_0092 [Lactobacillus phage ATCC 8014-B2]
MQMRHMKEVITINKFIKMLLLVLSYVVVLIAVYNFTDILQQNGGFWQMLFMTTLTTVYTYVLSSIDKETFRIRFSLYGVILYIAGIIGMALCYNASPDNGVAALFSIVATSLLIAGVIQSNG